jgi:hypothetical protein
MLTSRSRLFHPFITLALAASLSGCLQSGDSSSSAEPQVAQGDVFDDADNAETDTQTDGGGGGNDTPTETPNPPEDTTGPSTLAEPAIWLAQTHIQLLNNPAAQTQVLASSFDDNLQFAEDKLNTYLGTTGEKMLKLSGGKNALLKLDLTQDLGFSNPRVKATLYTKSGTVAWDGLASSPATIPASFDHRPGKVMHKLEESFLVTLPGEHLTTGAELAVVVEEQSPGSTAIWTKRFALNIGAPVVLPVTMFDFRVLENNQRTLPTEAMLELGRKIPVKELDFQRLEVNLDQTVFLPIKDNTSNIPHIRASSFTDWQTQAQKFTTSTIAPKNRRSVDYSQTLLEVMLRAGAQLYISSYHGNFNDGTSGYFKGSGNSSMYSSSTNASVPNALGVFAHEFSHNLDLYHWQERNAGKTYADKPYPYEGSMFGILQPTSSGNPTHNGPTWHYIPPTSAKPFGQAIPSFRVDAQANKIYKRVISTSGAQSDKLTTDQVGTFSDFDRRVSQHWLEDVVRVFNTQTGRWSTWNQATGSYDKTVGGSAGVSLPRQPEPESVLSLVFATSVANNAANLVYRPVGPYKSGIRFLYDPQNSTDRTLAQSRAYCPAATAASGGGCDYSVKVVQGTETRVYMLPVDDETNNLQRTVELTDDNAVKHTAINIAASGGAVQEITLYKTPNIERTAGAFNIQSAEVLFTRQF